jgi:hypothetical protein
MGRYATAIANMHGSFGPSGHILDLQQQPINPNDP